MNTAWGKAKRLFYASSRKYTKTKTFARKMNENVQIYLHIELSTFFCARFSGIVDDQSYDTSVS